MPGTHLPTRPRAPRGPKKFQAGPRGLATHETRVVRVRLRKPHPRQEEFVAEYAKRNVLKAGRRSGKTVGLATLAVKLFLEGKRVLYGAPTSEQIETFWFEVKRALHDMIEAGVVTKHEVTHTIEFPDTKQRIRAKTVWNADTLRGDYADVLILDEFQLINEDAWDTVGAPMLVDNDGIAFFAYTPPSLGSRSVSKAKDPTHASKMYRKAAKAAGKGRWKVFHFTSHSNPHISSDALEELSEDMTELAIRQEIYAEDIDEAPGAQWNRGTIERNRLPAELADELELVRLVVAVDPPSDSRARGSGCGIMVGGVDKHGAAFLLEDGTLDHATPDTWGSAVVSAYHDFEADRVVAEVNHGGEMVPFVVHAIDEDITVKSLHASRGKAVRAEPIAAKTERDRIKFVGSFPKLEDELCLWEPGMPSPHRLDAFVWLMTELTLGKKRRRAKASAMSVGKSR